MPFGGFGWFGISAQPYTYASEANPEPRVEPTSTVPIVSESVCYLCQYYDGTKDFSQFHWTVYTVNGTEIVVGVGKGGRVVAFTREHRPIKSTPEKFELRQAILRWFNEWVPLRREVLPLLQFGAMQRFSTAHTAEYRLYPHVMTIAGGGEKRAEELYDPTIAGPTITGIAYRHPSLFVNVFELQQHYEWPTKIADEYVRVAQRFVGYFYGKHVTAGQMGLMMTDERGDYDSSVTLTEEDWVEPFEMEDDCQLCKRMTDKSVEERVAAFQWELDKEAGARISASGGPRHTEYGVSAEARREYHAAVDLHLKEHPELWCPIPLIKLPQRVQRALCIQWNHVVRDWLQSDPRYCYSNGQYYVVWTERIGGFDPRPTRSDMYGSANSGYHAAAMAFGAYMAGLPASDYRPPDIDPSLLPDERDIWHR